MNFLKAKDIINQVKTGKSKVHTIDLDLSLQSPLILEEEGNVYLSLDSQEIAALVTATHAKSERALNSSYGNTDSKRNKVSGDYLYLVIHQGDKDVIVYTSNQVLSGQVNLHLGKAKTKIGEVQGGTLNISLKEGQIDQCWFQVMLPRIFIEHACKDREVSLRINTKKIGFKLRKLEGHVVLEPLSKSNWYRAHYLLGQDPNMEKISQRGALSLNSKNKITRIGEYQFNFNPHQTEDFE